MGTDAHIGGTHFLCGCTSAIEGIKRSDVRCLSGAEWPGGFCTIACETDVDCQADAACLEEEGGVCAFTCTSDADCVFLGQGYACKERDARGGAGKRMVCRGG